MDITATKSRVSCILLLLAASSLLHSCGSSVNLVQGIELMLTPGEPPPALNQTLNFRVSGLGTCRLLRIDWGDSPRRHFRSRACRSIHWC